MHAVASDEKARSTLDGHPDRNQKYIGGMDKAGKPKIVGALERWVRFVHVSTRVDVTESQKHLYRLHAAVLCAFGCICIA